MVYRDIFGGSGIELSDDDLLRGIYRLYLESLYSLLVSGGLGVDELVKLGRVIVPLCSSVVSSSSSFSGGGVRDVRELLRVVDG